MCQLALPPAYTPLTDPASQGQPTHPSASAVAGRHRWGRPERGPSPHPFSHARCRRHPLGAASQCIPPTAAAATGPRLLLVPPIAPPGTTATTHPILLGGADAASYAAGSPRGPPRSRGQAKGIEGAAATAAAG